MAEPVAPPDRDEVTRRIRSELDLRDKYLVFAQGQIEQDRSFYKYLYGFAAGFIAFMVVVAGIFSYTSVSQMRSEMKATIDTATKAAVEQLQEQTTQNLKNLMDAAKTQMNARNKEYTTSLNNLLNTTTQRTQQALAEVIRAQSELSDARQQLAQIRSLANSNPTMTLGQMDSVLAQRSPAPPKTYSRYSSPDDIKELQRRLKSLDCYSGEINGFFDEGTLAAVKRFNDHKNSIPHLSLALTPPIPLEPNTFVFENELSPFYRCPPTGNQK